MEDWAESQEKARAAGGLRLPWLTVINLMEQMTHGNPGTAVENGGNKQPDCSSR